MSRRTATLALGTVGPESRVLFAPRSYQRRVQEAWRAGATRLVTVWHRRAGKDVTWLAVALEAAMKRPGTYFHVYPTAALGRDALWLAQADGRRHLEVFPRELIRRTHETEMQIEFKNGSIWQIMGAEDPDALRGPNPYGIVLSEFSEMQGEVWDVLEPILAENGGWCGFNFTPKGRNHAFKLYQLARERVAEGDPRWHCDGVRTIDDTRRDADGESGEVVTPRAALDDARRLGKSEEFLQQEYYCSFDASLVGAYYGDLLRAAEREGRITRVPWEPTVPCVTAWDLGYDDATAIWVVQAVGREVRVLDYLEGDGEHVPYYAKQLKSLEYVYQEHLLPHDAEAQNIRAPLTIEQQLRSLGIRPTRIVERDRVELGIQAVRALLPKLVFDATRCRVGLERLSAYRKQRDRRTEEYRGKPLHDRASDAADALRTLAMGFKPKSERVMQPSRVQFSPFAYADRRPSRTAFGL